MCLYARERNGIKAAIFLQESMRVSVNAGPLWNKMAPRAAVWQEPFISLSCWHRGGKPSPKEQVICYYGFWYVSLARNHWKSYPSRFPVRSTWKKQQSPLRWAARACASGGSVREGCCVCKASSHIAPEGTYTSSWGQTTLAINNRRAGWKTLLLMGILQQWYNIYVPVLQSFHILIRHNCFFKQMSGLAGLTLPGKC